MKGTMTVSQAGIRGGYALKGKAAGEGNGNAFLSRLQVQAIRDCLALGWTKADLARCFRVSETTIRRIETGEAWR